MRVKLAYEGWVPNHSSIKEVVRFVFSVSQPKYEAGPRYLVRWVPVTVSRGIGITS